MNDITNTYLESVKIANFYCIKEPIQFKHLGSKKEIYILGENGDGKTLILQAILVALKWNFITTQTELAETGKLIDLIGKNKKINKRTNIQVESNHKNKFSLNVTQESLQNVFAYGVHRRPLSPNSSRDEEKYGFLSLFKDNEYLKSPIKYLLELYNQENEAKAQNITLKSAINLDKLKEILADLLDKNIEIEIINTKFVKFKERGFEVDFFSLSEGYKSVITWVIDMLARLIENQPTVKEVHELTGIVLVDEINLHLHPKWEYQIIRKLRAWFPNIQFIFTTHSPIVILGASEDAVFYRVYRENGFTQVSEAIENNKLANLMANGIITSPLFGLDSARTKSFDEKNGDLDTSDDFTFMLIHKQIAEQVEAMRKKGKVYFSQELLNQLIAQAIEKHKAK